MLSVIRRSLRPTLITRSTESSISRFFSLNVANNDSEPLNSPQASDMFANANSERSNGSIDHDLHNLEIAKAFRREHDIKLTGKECEQFHPMLDFDSTPFSTAIKRVFTKEGYSAPTHIQSQSWPIAVAGRDVISIARTGSGKTCGFLLPAFHMLNKSGAIDRDDAMQKGSDGNRRQRRDKRYGDRRGAPASPSILVLAPTRELAVQIQEEAMKFGRAHGIRSVVAHGGGGQLRRKQIEHLRQLPDVMVCTPGRCNDFIEAGVVDMSKIQYLVLDEADRMLDMGFQDQIESIIEATPPERQTSLFSATWPREVRGLASNYLKDPVHLQVGNGLLTSNKNIKQTITVVDERDKFPELVKLLKTLDPDELTSTSHRDLPKMIIFKNTKSECDMVTYRLKDLGISAESIHGDKSQSTRNHILDKFRKSRIKVLIATDVASRGLDVKDVEVVINLDCPMSAEDYVHRVGRTGRGEKSGQAYSFVTTKERSFAKEIIGVLERSEQEITPELSEIANFRGGGGGDRRRGRGGGGGGNRGRGGGGYGGGRRSQSFSGRDSSSCGDDRRGGNDRGWSRDDRNGGRRGNDRYEQNRGRNERHGDKRSGDDRYGNRNSSGGRSRDDSGRRGGGSYRGKSADPYSSADF